MHSPKEIKQSWEDFSQCYNFRKSPDNYLMNIEFIHKIISNEEKLVYPYILLPNSVKGLLYMKFATDPNDVGISYESLRNHYIKLHKNLEWEEIPPVSLKEPTMPRKKTIGGTITYSYYKRRWPLILGTLGFWLIITGSFGWSIVDSPWGLLLSMLFIPTIIIAMYKCELFEPIKGTREKVLTDIEREKINQEIENKYLSELIDYYNSLEQYNRSIAKHNRVFEEQRNAIQEDLDHLFKIAIQSRLVKREQLEIIDNAPNRGISENLLFEKLMEIRPNYVCIDRKKGEYYPDIVINIKDLFWIDIEIDEPYEIVTKKEIHYIGKDDRRNKYFQSERWIVVRFSEQNIQENLKYCVKLIDWLIVYLKTMEPAAIENVIDIQNHIQHPQWTKEHARLMAINNSRLKYVI